jgi:hypothetical protein
MLTECPVFYDCEASSLEGLPIEIGMCPRPVDSLLKSRVWPNQAYGWNLFPKGGIYKKPFYVIAAGVQDDYRCRRQRAERLQAASFLRS